MLEISKQISPIRSIGATVLACSFCALFFPLIVSAQSSEPSDNSFSSPVYESQLYLIEQSTIQPVDVGQAPEESVYKYGNNPPTTQALPPPSNDNCSDGLGPAYTLFPGASCLNGTLKNIGGTGNATIEPGETTGCMTGPPTKTVWYNFTATATDMWISLQQTSTPFVCSQNFGIRVYPYSGACPPPSGAAVDCKDYTAYSAGQIYNILNMTGLTIGQTYMVQIGNHPGCGYHDFCIQLGVPSVCDNCSNVCGPMCTFAGPTQPSVATVTSTCTGYPYSPPLNQFDTRTSCFTFTAPNDSISLQQIVNSYCSPNTYSFTYELFDASCNSIQTGNVFANNTITGLTPGVNYRICYSLEAACTWEGQYYPYLYTTATVLPVELLFFDAFVRDRVVELYWSTATELNALEYVVEKTLNGKDFEFVSRVEAAGNSSVTLSYRTVDLNPAPGMAFYRLKQVDYDGSYTYSKLVAARYADHTDDMSVFPNPSDDGVVNLKLLSETDTNYELTVFDINGRVVDVRMIDAARGFNLVPVDLTALNSGYYLLRIASEFEQNYSKVIIERD
jgi:hypothetical protein